MLREALLLRDIENDITARQYLAAMSAIDGREGKLMLLNSAIRIETPWAADPSSVSKEQHMVDLYNRLKPEKKK